ncbi:MAG: WecB/TagA/CpsF family glycosyltransferase [Ignavibacteriaceae bacterium]|nr:WecB/TagA/CpsF family glycosyltransferase [Ignavibacteriaceae bacterium]
MANKISVLGLEVDVIQDSELLNSIETNLLKKQKFALTYANAHCAMIFRKSAEYRFSLSRFSLIHPDGIAMSLASRYLNPGETVQRMTGSDFYPFLIEKAIEKQCSLFIFGDTNETLERISERNPSLKISGMSTGFNFSETLSSEISRLKPDLVLIGLGVPKQEIWISDNWDALPDAVYLAMGEGLRVLAGTKKRGGKLLQKAGLEWAVRLFSNPVRLWKRYLIRMPVFLFMVVIQKFRGKSE